MFVRGLRADVQPRNHLPSRDRSVGSRTTAGGSRKSTTINKPNKYARRRDGAHGGDGRMRLTGLARVLIRQQMTNIPHAHDIVGPILTN